MATWTVIANGRLWADLREFGSRRLCVDGRPGGTLRSLLYCLVDCLDCLPNCLPNYPSCLPNSSRCTGLRELGFQTNELLVIVRALFVTQTDADYAKVGDAASCTTPCTAPCTALPPLRARAALSECMRRSSRSSTATTRAASTHLNFAPPSRSSVTTQRRRRCATSPRDSPEIHPRFS